MLGLVRDVRQRNADASAPTGGSQPRQQRFIPKVSIIGASGTGKTHLLRCLLAAAAAEGAVTLPTAFSAASAHALGGETASAAFGLRDRGAPAYVDRSCSRKLDVVVIDDAMMLTANDLDSAVNSILGGAGPAVMIILALDPAAMLPVMAGLSKEQRVARCIISASNWSPFRNSKHRYTLLQQMHTRSASLAQLVCGLGNGTANASSEYDSWEGCVQSVLLPREVFTQECSLARARRWLLEGAAGAAPGMAMVICTTNPQAQEHNDAVLRLLPGAAQVYPATASVRMHARMVEVRASPAARVSASPARLPVRDHACVLGAAAEEGGMSTSDGDPSSEAGSKGGADGGSSSAAGTKSKADGDTSSESGSEGNAGGDPTSRAGSKGTSDGDSSSEAGSDGSAGGNPTSGAGSKSTTDGESSSEAGSEDNSDGDCDNEVGACVCVTKQEQQSEFVRWPREANCDDVLCLKVGAPVRVSCNVWPEQGLFTNALATVVALGADSVTVRMVSPRPGAAEVAEFGRSLFDDGVYQFPLKLGFAVTAQRAAAFTPERVVVDLRKPCWAHGQLAVMLGRARSCSSLLVLHGNTSNGDASDGVVARNVVLKEVIAGVL